MELYTKLANIQKELKAPKNQFNSFGKYKYRSCEDILEAAKPMCLENGLVLTLSDKVINVGDRYYIEATAKVIDISDDKEFYVTASAREEENKKGMDGSQITGTASSYARKYALNGLFCIDDTKDADTNEHKKQESKEASPTNNEEAPKVSVQQLQAAMDKKGITVKQILATYKKDQPNAKTCTDIKFLPQLFKVKYFNMCQ